MKSISIILPTYCEAGNINNLIKDLIKHLKLSNRRLQIIVVDDDSPDGTAQEVKKLVKKNLPVELFVRKNQRGLATAIAYGVKKSKGDVIVLMDTDFNHQPKDVPRLLQPILEQKADLDIEDDIQKQARIAKIWQFISQSSAIESSCVRIPERFCCFKKILP